MSTESAELIKSVPAPEVVRERLSQNARERSFLKKLLDLARQAEEQRQLATCEGSANA